MENKAQKNSIILAIAGFTTVVVVAGLIGYFTLGKSEDVIQGEIEVSEYRVSSKVPGRILELRVKEGVLQTTDVMEAQTAWMQAQSQKIDAEVDVKISQVNLKKALGVLN